MVRCAIGIMENGAKGRPFSELRSIEDTSDG